jgi:hypothetical protein
LARKNSVLNGKFKKSNKFGVSARRLNHLSQSSIAVLSNLFDSNEAEVVSLEGICA